MTSIKDLLPDNKKKNIMFQGRAREDLLQQVNEIKDRLNLSWSDVLNACFTKFIQEMTSAESKKK